MLCCVMCSTLAVELDLKVVMPQPKCSCDWEKSLLQWIARTHCMTMHVTFPDDGSGFLRATWCLKFKSSKQIKSSLLAYYGESNNMDKSQAASIREAN